MSALPAGIAAEAGQIKQNIALSVIKQTAEQDKKMADILEKSARSSPLDQSRGSNVDLRV